MLSLYEISVDDRHKLCSSRQPKVLLLDFCESHPLQDSVLQETVESRRAFCVAPRVLWSCEPQHLSPSIILLSEIVNVKWSSSIKQGCSKVQYHQLRVDGDLGHVFKE